ncbi:MAG TPA: VWA domain-containing protein [Terriglobales bacterium]|nr:VWA domain-containing protein [Terriglobales bacterium]
MFIHKRSALWWVWPVVLFLAALAQDDPPPQSIKTYTKLVSVPVVVTRKGILVSGLKREDLILEQDGIAVKLNRFEFIVPDPALSEKLSVLRPKVSDPAPSLTDQYNSLAVIVLDPLNTPQFSQKDGLGAVLEFLAKGLRPGQPTALLLLTSNGLKVITDFSTDAGTLRNAALALHEQKGGKRMVREVEGNTNGQDSAFGGSANPVELPSTVTGSNLITKVLEGLVNEMHAEERVAKFEATENARITLRSFSSLAQVLAKLPGRKSLIWFSGGLPFPSDYKRYASNEIGDMYGRVLSELNDASVSVYPIHLRGLEVVSPENDVTIDRYQRGAGLNTSAWYDRSNTRIDTARDIAYRTGGIAFVHTNDFAKALTRALEDGSGYYMLTYYVPKERTSPGWHSLKVRLRDGRRAEIRSRNGFVIKP